MLDATTEKGIHSWLYQIDTHLPILGPVCHTTRQPSDALLSSKLPCTGTTVTAQSERVVQCMI